MSHNALASTPCSYSQLFTSVFQFPAETVLQHMVRLNAEGRINTANLLVFIAVADERRDYLGAGYPSMYAYCIEALGLSEDAALKRIHAARAGRRFPEVFEAVADGRLHLSGLNLLCPNLTDRTSEAAAAELIAAASRKTHAQIRTLLADRLPKFDAPESLVPVRGSGEHATSHVALKGSGEPAPGNAAPETSGEHATQHVPWAVATPLGLDRFALQVTLDRATHDKLRYAQSLLSHAVPGGELAQVLGRALDALIGKLERRKFGAAKKPRVDVGAEARLGSDPRSIPAAVKREVCEREQGCCTFTGPSGHRCGSTRRLEFDHVVPVACGGATTVENLRLRCRAHNQLEAERMFGTEFMAAKRRERPASPPPSPSNSPPSAASEPEDVVPWLRALGLKLEDARQLAKRCESMGDAPLEARVRVAISGWFRGRKLAAAG